MKTVSVRHTLITELDVNVEGESGWTADDYRHAAVEQCKAFPHRLVVVGDRWIARKEGARDWHLIEEAQS